MTGDVYDEVSQRVEPFPDPVGMTHPTRDTTVREVGCGGGKRD